MQCSGCVSGGIRPYKKLPGSPFFNSLKAAVPPLLLAGGILAAYCCPFPSLCQNISQGQVMAHALEQM